MGLLSLLRFSLRAASHYLEQLMNHTSPFSNILLDNLTANDTNKASICLIDNSTC